MNLNIESEKRNYFRECFRLLQPLRGLLQYEKMKEARQTDEFNRLITGMVRVSNSFGYIPWHVQKKQIDRKIEDDPDFTRLDASKIWQWLNEIANLYFHESSHEKKESNDKTFYFDELSENTKKEVQSYMVMLSQGTGFKPVPTVSQSEIDALKIEDLEQIEGKKAISIGHQTTIEEFEFSEKKMEWIRLFTDPYTGKLKDGAPKMMEWIERKTKA